MQRKKLRLYNQAKKSKSWSNYRFYQKECKRAFRKAEYEYINNVISEGLQNNDSKPFWKYIKNKQQENIGVSPLLDKGNLYVDNKSKAQILLNQFASVFTKPSPVPLPKVKPKTSTSLSDIKIEEKGVLKLLKNLKVSKAPGPDAISTRIVKECADELCPGITRIFQRSLDTGVLPEDWTSANIAPIFKKGDRHLAENYRPVSLTPVLSKTLEHIVFTNMVRHLEENKVLTPLNHGFRAGYSCETQLVITIDDLTRNFDQGYQTDVAILDFSKAFDTVPHSKLLQKLSSYGITGNLHQWISAFLCNRRMRVVLDGEASEETQVLSGVPQGTVLGPLLFLVHANDLPERVLSQVRLFADDCLLYRTIKDINDHLALKNDLLQLQEWAKDNGMCFNTKKCYILSIPPKSGKKFDGFYELNNTILQEVSSNPYLGVELSKDLTFSTHISNICSRASSTLGFLRRNLQHTPSHLRRNAYFSLVRSTLEYAATVWDPVSKAEIDQLENIQRRAARFISKDYKSREPGCVNNMLKTHDLQPLEDRRKLLRLTFLFKIYEGLVPAIPPETYLTKMNPSQKRQIKARTFTDCVSTNFVSNYQSMNSKRLELITSTTDVYSNSFFCRTIREWNGLAEDTISATSVESFKARLLRN